MAKNKTRRSTGGLRGKRGNWTAFIALLCVIFVGACVWLIGWDITGNINPALWGTSQTQPETPKEENAAGDGETAGLIIRAPRIAARSTSASLDDNGGIMLLDNTRECPYCYSIMSELSRSQATCVSGSQIHWHCDNEDCGQDYFETISGVDPNNHAGFVYTRDVTPATCVLSGTALYTCGCGKKTEKRSIPATGVHRYSWVVTTAPSNGNPGVESYKCETCTSVTDTRNFFALPEDPVMEGHHFVGWYYDKECTRPYDGEPIYGSFDLTAKFEINEYTVTFDSDGGNEIESITAEWNEPITPETPEKTGYNFLGWYLADGTKYEKQAIVSDTVLTARWQIKTFTVTFYVNGAVYSTVTVEYGAVLSKVADNAEIFAKNILSFENVNSETPAVSASEMSISDDIVVYANEPTLVQKIFQSKYLPWEIGGVCLLIAIGVTVGIVEKKKRG